ncbi:MAG: hypothetical protein COA47_01680 [Robiginitomaculum sp.]|nr:MAG: hypothetical protein COA47_01680 [Robiginitomaculum sp.]
MLKRIFAICLGLILVTAIPARAQTDSAEYLERAEADIQKRRDATEGQRFGFAMQVIGEGDETSDVSLIYNPDNSANFGWTIVSPTLSQNKEIFEETQKQIESDAKHNPQEKSDQELIVDEIFDEEAAGFEYLRDDGNVAVFKFNADGSISMGRGEDDGDGPDFNKYMKAELGIDKELGRLAWIHIYAPKPFKPVIVAKIKKMDIWIHFAPAWTDGPLVQVREEVHVSGSAMFQKFSEHVIEIYSDFQPK